MIGFIINSLKDIKVWSYLRTQDRQLVVNERYLCKFIEEQSRNNNNFSVVRLPNPKSENESASNIQNYDDSFEKLQNIRQSVLI